MRRLAQHPDLGLELVAGRENADRPISWAHAIELADPAPYLFGGELVMTTGLTVGTTGSEQFDYVARLSAARVAALAFDTGTTFPDVPDGIVAAGDAFGMPVLKVPASTPFIAITRVVIDEVNADEVRSVQRIVDQQEMLARQTLRGGIPALVSALSQALSVTAVVLGTDGRVLATGGPDQDRISRLAADHIRKARPTAGRGQASRVVVDGQGYCTLQSLRATQTVRGYLAVRSAQPLSNRDRLLVANAVSLISIELEKPARVIDAEQRLRTAVTQTILVAPGGGDPGPSRPPVEPAVLRYFGFDPEADIVTLVFSNVGPALTAETQARQILDGIDSAYLMCTRDDDLIVVLPAAEAGHAEQFHQGLSAQLQRPVNGGASLPHEFAEIGSGLQQARTASRAASDGRLSDFGELGPFGVILGGRSTEELDILGGSLDPLDEHDRDLPADSPGLVATLHAFLQNNGHVENAATSINIHRHTMRNRLARIGELLDRDLQSADVRAELWIAIKARELRSAPPHTRARNSTGG